MIREDTLLHKMCRNNMRRIFLIYFNIGYSLNINGEWEYRMLKIGRFDVIFNLYKFFFFQFYCVLVQIIVYLSIGFKLYFGFTFKIIPVYISMGGRGK